MFCKNCGQELSSDIKFCPNCGAPAGTNALPDGVLPADVANKKMTAGILGILLGGWGIHKFYLGMTSTGLIMLALTLCSCGVLGILGFIEGIIYLTKTDEAFYREYIVGRRQWF
ncbi:MAG: TM2 domain-containing protein [Victivallaceae bacterium]|nr:TM2 domain-containing protein [Victivallaceae bacterium]